MRSSLSKGESQALNEADERINIETDGWYARILRHEIALGVGLAAPQIGEPLQLVIVEDKAEYQATMTPAELAERERRPVAFHVLINPEIELLLPSDVSFFEGCLCLPGFMAIASAPTKPNLGYRNKRL